MIEPDAVGIEVVGADAIAELWRTFGAAVTVERLRRAYGAYWPRRPVAGERVWIFRATPAPGAPCGELAAWGALRPDPVEPFVWSMVGVWPQHQRSGWAPVVRRWLVTEAVTIAFPDARYAVSEILKSNDEHLARITAQMPEGWRRVGELDVPPPGTVFFAFDMAERRTG